jgi:kinesin family protein 2/24
MNVVLHYLTSELENGDFDVITLMTSRYPFAQAYIHEPKVRLDLGQEINTHKFQFDNVFDESSTNQEIYLESAKPLIDSFLNGGFSTLFAYGQTGPT